MRDLIGIVADQLTRGYLEPCEIHDALVRGGMTEEEAYLTYVAGQMVYAARKAAFETRHASKPTIKLKAVKELVSLTAETPMEPIVLCDRNDPPSL